MLVRATHTKIRDKLKKRANYSTTSDTQKKLIKKQIQVDPKILEQLKHHDKTLLKQASTSQAGAGYMPDDWQLMPFGKIKKVIVQSLVSGEKSLWLPTSFKYEDIRELTKTTPPIGTSQYFASVAAFSKTLKIHAATPGAGEHYHNNTQVSEGFCLKTGKKIFDHRKHLGIFTAFPDWMDDIRVAVSKAEANTSKFLQIQESETKIHLDLGDGGAQQIFVPQLLIPYIHAHCTRLISQDDIYGVQVVERQIDDNGIYTWNFRQSGKNAKLPALDVVQVGPAGDAHCFFKPAPDKATNIGTVYVDPTGTAKLNK